MRLICLAIYEKKNDHDFILQRSEPNFDLRGKVVHLNPDEGEKPSSSVFQFSSINPISFFREKLIDPRQPEESNPLERFNNYIENLGEGFQAQPVNLFSADQYNYYFSLYNDRLYLAISIGNPNLQNLFVLSWFSHMGKQETQWSDIIKNPYGYLERSADKIAKIKEEMHIVEEQLHSNIESILQRGERIENLVAKTDELSAVSLDFRKRAEEMPTGCCDAPRKAVNRVWR